MKYPVRIVVLAVAVVLAAVVPAAGADRAVTVSVDCGKTLKSQPVLWGHVNVSRRAPPPKQLCAVVERQFGRPKVTRCWLMLDQMWDYRTGTSRFNYEINKDDYEGGPNKKRYGVAGRTTGLHYYDYVDSVSAHSETVLVNIRRYEQEVLTGMLTFDQWKEVFKAAVRHYKRRCPNPAPSPWSPFPSPRADRVFPRGCLPSFREGDQTTAGGSRESFRPMD